VAAEPGNVRTEARYVLSLAEAAESDERRIGGKAANLARLAQAGVRVPEGFCITSAAYERYVQAGGLTSMIQSELGRKPLDQMRWEEIWDAALRLRAIFINTPVPAPVVRAIGDALRELGFRRAVAVRSSAPGEDSAQRSFAGLHESYLDVVGEQAVLDAVRLVWASLWSDAALLYRRELDLDPAQSRMAVLVQAMVDERPSGVAFGRDPRDADRDAAIVEAVPGPCSDLVDGLVDPDRWVLERSSGEVLEWRSGEREAGGFEPPLLGPRDLRALYRALVRLESFFGWPPDVEWTGRGERLTLLQARPVTTSRSASDGKGRAAGQEEDKRPWYLSLRPGKRRLRALRERVAGELIPKLAAQGRRFAEQEIEGCDDARLARAIEERWEALQTWREIYWDEFIPFAHGVRQLALYYNDAVRPADPYEFVGLLQGERLLAAQRNRALGDLADQLLDNAPIWAEVRAVARTNPDQDAAAKAERALERIRDLPGGPAFLTTVTRLQESLLDVAFGEQRLSGRPDLLLSTLDELARARKESSEQELPQVRKKSPSVRALEGRLLAAVGPERRAEAEEVLATARVSWRLRDDDNLLLGRIESQLLRAVRLGAERLRAAGRLAHEGQAGDAAAPVVSQALRDPQGGRIELPDQEDEPKEVKQERGESPRQLVGQPASPGMATGRARRVQELEDLGRFRAGEVLVCDAIQPTMTHLVPLACAVVERRGGMLIHGAIIARELGIPCVNGIPGATEVLADGELLTVDGYLGIVTVGAPEFDLEKIGVGP
jgi:pyruvate,water dikinase